MISLIEKTYYEVDLPFPQTPGGTQSATKKGCIYKVSFEGMEREVNLSPFPGLSDYTLEQTCLEFESSLSTQQTQNPHVEFALYKIKKEVKSTAKVLENLFTPLDQMIPLFESGFSEGVIKTKINNSKETKETLLKVLVWLKKNGVTQTKLRLDANTSLSVDDLYEIWELFISNKVENLIEYFEEPLTSYNEYKNLKDIPYAHEEFIQEYLQSPSQANALIVKPSQTGINILGSIKNRFPNKKLIISSAFEFTDDLPLLRELALIYEPSQYHGLKAVLNKSNIRRTKTIKF